MIPLTIAGALAMKMGKSFTSIASRVNKSFDSRDASKDFLLVRKKIAGRNVNDIAPRRLYLRTPKIMS